MNLSSPLTADNVPTLFVPKTGGILPAVIRTYPVVLASGVFHFNTAFNADGQAIYISAWGAGSSGPVNGY